ncbi:leucine efflux protein LeuE [Rosenbergiella australiborealis]|uniref:Leucine efflux protein LeuE n=1 Tax=Rosenbergiella australiborealis TaxID=1544696 RepID=A0ABS5T9N0_9GAMM|nr:leucine efflux protein LeuE [Rosenbergiella australiborealis]
MFAEYGVLNFWTYVAGAIFLVLIPGPNTLFVLKNSVGRGVKYGYQAATAVFIGDAVLMFLAYAGVATLINTTPVLFNVVRYLGAGYLLWLGIKMLYTTFSHRESSPVQSAKKERGAVFKRALVLSLTNPKAILFYVSFFVQFIDVKSAHPGIAFFILATVLEIASFCYLSLIIFTGASLTRVIGTRQRLAKVGNSMIGLLFLGFAARLATMQ